MSTPWTVKSDADRVKLDQQHRAEVMFSVGNTGDRPDRAVFDVVTDPAVQDWFAVEEPQRFVPGAGTVRYKVTATAPAAATPGRYQMQGRVYSLDSAPEETSVLSGKVVIEIPGAPPLPRRRPPWLLIGAGALTLVIVIVVVLVVVLGGGPAKEQALSPTVVVPDITKLPEDQAMASLLSAGLTPKVKHRQVVTLGPATQSFQPGLAVARGTVIDVVFQVHLAPPVILTPKPPYSTLPSVPGDPMGAQFGLVASSLNVTWTQPEPYVTSWRVLIQANVCAIKNDQATLNTDTFLNPDSSALTTTPSFTTLRYYVPTFTTSPNNLLPYGCGDEYVRVAALDDFGTMGATSSPVQYGLATK
jgi:hypothetical protein